MVFPNALTNDLGMLKVLSKKRKARFSVILTMSGYSPVVIGPLIRLRKIPMRNISCLFYKTKHGYLYGSLCCFVLGGVYLYLLH